MTSIGGFSGSGRPRGLAHFRLPLADRLPGAAEAHAPAAVVTSSFESDTDTDADADTKSDFDFEARA